MSTSRHERLAPKGIPRWIRCYDNGGATADRYTVVFTGRYRHKTGGATWYISMNHEPFHPQGIGMHGEFTARDRWPHDDGTWQHDVDRPRYSHLGKKMSFSKLPVDCQKAVLSTYLDIWDFKIPVTGMEQLAEAI